MKSAAMLLTLALLAGCKAELLTGLSQRQANEAIALLLRNGIDASKQDIGKGRFRIDVERDTFADAVRLLDKYQLPSRDDVSIADLFPSDSFVNSPTTERARLISGLELRLEQTARSIDRVLSARVHISYPLSEKADPDKSMHVSMMLNYDGSMSDAMLIQRLKQLVRNSFESLSYENISVVVFHATAGEPVAEPAKAPLAWSGWRWLAAGGAALLPLIAALGIFWHRRRSVARAERQDAVVTSS
ncbi:type III secretion system inner membrane ring lipoprotein SctJ [Achromobacter xylosoxidans]